MTNIITISAEQRSNVGKGPSRSLRREGKIPAIIYGKNHETILIALSEREISRHAKKASFRSSLLDINLAGKNYRVLQKDVEFNPVTDRIEHLDFLHVDKNMTVKVMVHFHFINEDKAPGVKKGGVLNILTRDIELMCNPQNIPHTIDIDLSSLNIGESIHINDIVLPKGVTLVSGSRNITIATIVGRIDDSETPASIAASEEKPSA